MTRVAKNAMAEAIIEGIFLEAQRNERRLTADELMRAIGLKRTSINSTYLHVNERRKQHNASLVEAERISGRAAGRGETERDKLRSDNAQLRQDIQAERKRSEQYAKVIRHLALENHQLKFGGDSVTDARSRFGDL